MKHLLLLLLLSPNGCMGMGMGMGMVPRVEFELGSLETTIVGVGVDRRCHEAELFDAGGWFTLSRSCHCTAMEHVVERQHWHEHRSASYQGMSPWQWAGLGTANLGVAALFSMPCLVFGSCELMGRAADGSQEGVGGFGALLLGTLALYGGFEMLGLAVDGAIKSVDDSGSTVTHQRRALGASEPCGEEAAAYEVISASGASGSSWVIGMTDEQGRITLDPGATQWLAEQTTAVTLRSGERDLLVLPPR